MTKIKYVGVKEDGETAFARESGIDRWMKGDSHEITNNAVAHKMLQHPDVFARDDRPVKAAPAATPAASPSPAAAPAPTDAPAPPPAPAVTLAAGTKVGDAPVDPLADLDEAGVRAYAKEQGLKIKGIGLLKGKKLRTAVTQALAAKAAKA